MKITSNKQTHENMSMKCIPLIPHFCIEKLGFTGVYPIFLIFDPKNTLWVISYGFILDIIWFYIAPFSDHCLLVLFYEISYGFILRHFLIIAYLYLFILDIIWFYTTVCTASSRNCIFQNLTFLKDLKKNINTSPFCISKVLKSATKILKIGLQIKILCQKIILNRASSIVTRGPLVL